MCHSGFPLCGVTWNTTWGIPQMFKIIVSYPIIRSLWHYTSILFPPMFLLTCQQIMLIHCQCLLLLNSMLPWLLLTHHGIISSTIDTLVRWTLVHPLVPQDNFHISTTNSQLLPLSIPSSFLSSQWLPPTGLTLCFIPVFPVLLFLKLPALLCPLDFLHPCLSPLPPLFSPLPSPIYSLTDLEIYMYYVSQCSQPQCPWET